MIAPIKVLLAALLLFGPALALEVTSRALIDAERLPMAPTSNTFADISLANLVRGGQPDVLVLGTSAARAAIRPAVLEELLAAETGRELQVRNAAQGGIDLRDQLLLVEGLDGLGLLPDTVILPVSAVTMTGVHPQGGWFERSELGQLWSGCTTDDVAAPPLECWLGQGSALWRWRGQPEQIVEAVTGTAPVTLRDGKRKLHEDGWMATDPTNAKGMRNSTERMIEMLGEEVDLPEHVAHDFTALIEELQARGVTVVAVEMPYADQLQDELTTRNPDWAQQRRSAYQQLEEVSGLDIIEVDRFGPWAKVKSFRDAQHLSRLGAEPFTRQLWDEPEFRERLLEGLASAD